MSRSLSLSVSVGTPTDRLTHGTMASSSCGKKRAFDDMTEDACKQFLLTQGYVLDGTTLVRLLGR